MVSTCCDIFPICWIVKYLFYVEFIQIVFFLFCFQCKNQWENFDYNLKIFHFCFSEYYSSSSWKDCHILSVKQKVHNVHVKFRKLCWTESRSIWNIVHSNNALMKWNTCFEEIQQNVIFLISKRRSNICK
jgi:hypothetical protein